MRKRRVNIDSNQQKLLLTMEEAAQALSLGLSSIYKLVLCKQIASVKIGRQRRVPVDALKEFIALSLEK